ncbi:MAG: hypothetical protein FJ288_13460 [Planctomycetes bacterium]|nr:hypothetical protein [Planctomycetota bacterium]
MSARTEVLPRLPAEPTPANNARLWRTPGGALRASLAIIHAGRPRRLDFTVPPRVARALRGSLDDPSRAPS